MSLCKLNLLIYYAALFYLYAIFKGIYFVIIITLHVIRQSYVAQIVYLYPTNTVEVMVIHNTCSSTDGIMCHLEIDSQAFVKNR